jgi:hypothetical protein
MVDLTLSSVIAASLPSNVYVAVRIGDTQKLGRLGNERLYKFPPSAVSDHRFGKIEFLQRIGSCTVGIIPEKDGDQEVELSLGSGNLKFTVQLERPKGHSSQKVESDKPLLKPFASEKPKLTLAKKYLEEHDLERRLKDAVQEVISAMPEDPAAFIGQKLAGNNVVTRTFTHAAAPAATKEAGAQAEEAVRESSHPLENIAELPARATTPVAPLSFGAIHPELPPRMATPSAPEAIPPQLPAPGLPPREEGDATPSKQLAKVAQADQNVHDADILRLQLKESLSKACLSGSLDDTVTQIVESQAEVDNENLRLKMQRSFFEATKSGKLDEGFTKLNKITVSPEAELETVRIVAKSAEPVRIETLSGVGKEDAVALPGMLIRGV